MGHTSKGMGGGRKRQGLRKGKGGEEMKSSTTYFKKE